MFMIVAIVGPTGVGKTKMSVELAKKFDGIVINCDAMQVYIGMDIGTAKVTEDEKEGVPHYLFDICDVTKNYTVYDYQKDLRLLLEKYKDKNIFIVGGTGLYLKSGLFDFRFPLEENISNNNDELTNEELYKMALEKDKNMNIHVNNRKRLVRFLNKENIEIVEPKQLYNALFIGLTTDRENLYNIINNRVDKMFNNGLLEEARKFYDMHIESKALSTAIGYKELFEYFDGSISLEEAKELIKQRSRRYAKRQYTYFNNQLDVNWFNVDYDNFNNTINEVVEYIKKSS